MVGWLLSCFFVVLIVPSMSHLEICNALFADRPKLEMRVETLKPRMAKQFKREGICPARLNKSVFKSLFAFRRHFAYLMYINLNLQS